MIYSTLNNYLFLERLMMREREGGGGSKFGVLYICSSKYWSKIMTSGLPYHLIIT